MIEILADHKGTDSKLRWDADINGAPFELYIPKWRVPDPVPSVIRVRYILREINLLLAEI